MAKFKEEHPDYFNTFTFPKDPRPPVTIYKDENYDEFASSHPKVNIYKCLPVLDPLFCQSEVV